MRPVAWPGGALSLPVCVVPGSCLWVVEHIVAVIAVMQIRLAHH